MTPPVPDPLKVAVACRLMRDRGYLVIGYASEADQDFESSLITSFGGAYMGQELVVIGPTDRADWLEQMRIMYPDFRERHKYQQRSNHKSAVYLRCRMDPPGGLSA